MGAFSVKSIQQSDFQQGVQREIQVAQNMPEIFIMDMFLYLDDDDIGSCMMVCRLFRFFGRRILKQRSMTKQNWKTYMNNVRICIWREQRDMRWGLVLNEIKNISRQMTIDYWNAQETIEDDGCELINFV